MCVEVLALIFFCVRMLECVLCVCVCVYAGGGAEVSENLSV